MGIVASSMGIDGSSSEELLITEHSDMGIVTGPSEELLIVEHSDMGIVATSMGTDASSSVPNTMPNSEGRWLNDSVYELHKPKGTPNMQVVFFHGLQFGDCKDPHLSAWETGEGSDTHIWPRTWLVEKFPHAHVLSVSYDARVRKEHGNFDLHTIGENLTSDLVLDGTDIGQNPRCPVILVGHCFGGLVIKQVCLHARKEVSLKEASSLNSSKLSNFLGNVRGVYFYGTPHHGIPLGNIAGHFVSEGPLLEFVKVLSISTSRLNSDFDHLILNYKWRIAGLGENLPTKWGRFNKVVAPEASARYGEFNVVEVDHISICKPKSRTSSSFSYLTQLIAAAIQLDSKGNLPAHRVQGLPSYLADSDEPEIQRQLKDKQVLGIVGMGGIGKSTLAKVVFNNISWQFEYTCFADNVKGRRINEVQALLLSNFYRNGSRCNIFDWSHAQGKTTLIVMDDVDSEEQLKVLPELPHFSSNTRVIITTRDKSVLTLYGDVECVCHDVEFLKEDVAKKLFCKHVFGEEDIPSSFTGRELEQLKGDVQAVIKKCGGLPLTLEVMGRYLKVNQKDGYKKVAKIWKETIDKLGKAQAINGATNDRVWAVLKVSYDGLQIEEREMFVSAATCFFEDSLERALAAWSTSCEYSETTWRNLMERSLVKEVCYDFMQPHEMEYKTVWVHEHLRDLAKKIAPGKMMVASNGEEVDNLVALLNTEQVEAVSETEFLRVRNNDWDKRTGKQKQGKIRWDSLLNLQNLKYMELVNVLTEGTAQKLPKKISLLRIRDTRRFTDLLGDFEFPVIDNCIEDLDNLAILELENLQISPTFPAALENLTNLRMLTLKNVKGVDRLPVALDRLSKLKHMYLANLSVPKLPESFGNLSSLEHLEFSYVPLTELPNSFGSLSSLEHLNFDGVPLTELPNSFGSLSSLEHLDFDGVPLTELPDSFGSLSSLQQLRFENVQLAELPNSFGNLSSLERLDFDGIPLTELPNSFGSLSSLEYLSFIHVPLTELPDSFGSLSSLEHLQFIYVPLTELPDSFGNLRSLVSLEFLEVELKELPESFGNLGSLVTLRFVECKKLERLTDTFGQLTALRTLKIEKGEKLSWLPSSLGGLTSLQTLEIHAPALETFPETLGHLASLETLKIKMGEKFRWLPSSLGGLTSLQTLEIAAPALETFPETLGHLASLKKLKILTEALEVLPENLGQLASLQRLEIRAKGVKILPESVGKLSRLQKFIFESSCVEALPHSLGQLTSLQELDLHVTRVQGLPESVGQLTSLRDLSFSSDCVESLPDSLGQLASLQSFWLTAPQMKVLPESMGHLSALRNLFLVHCQQLVSLPDNFLRWSSLRERGEKKMCIQDCPLLHDSLDLRKFIIAYP